MSRYCPGTKCSARNSVPNKGLIITCKRFEKSDLGDTWLELAFHIYSEFHQYTLRRNTVPQKMATLWFGHTPKERIVCPYLNSDFSFLLILTLNLHHLTVYDLEEKLAIICFFVLFFFLKYITCNTVKGIYS